MATQVRCERRFVLPAGPGTLLVRVFRPGGPRRGFADAEGWDPSHLGLNLVLHGQGGYRQGRQEWPLAPGTVFVRQPGRRHSTWSDAAYAECSLGFAAAWAPHLAALGALPDVPVIAGPPQPQAADELTLLAADLQRARDDDGPALVARAAAAAAVIVQRTAAGDDALLRARSAIDCDPAARLDLRQLAAAAGCSPTAFRRAFRRAFGLAPLAYRQRQRLAQADALLRSGLRVKEAAVRLGYPSAEALCVQFRARYGMPPGRRFSPPGSPAGPDPPEPATR